MASTIAMRLRNKMIENTFINYHVDLSITYVALTFTPPKPDSWGVLMAEPLFGNYARVPYRMGSDYWLSSGTGEVQNIQLISFPMFTWGVGNIEGWALMDSPAVNSGNMLACGSLLTPFYCNTGDVPTIARGGLTVGVYA